MENDFHLGRYERLLENKYIWLKENKYICYAVYIRIVGDVVGGAVVCGVVNGVVVPQLKLSQCTR